MSSVKWFHEYFKELLDEKHISVKQLAVSTTFNYIKLLQVLKGDELLSRREFETLISYEPFTLEEIQNIRHHYNNCNINKYDRERVLFVEETLKSLYDTVVEKSSLVMMKRDKQQLDYANRVEAVCKLINDQLFKCYNDVLKSSMITGEQQDFEIEFRIPPNEPLIHEVYHTLQALQGCKNPLIEVKISFLIDFYEEDVDKRLNHILDLSKYIKLITLNDIVTITCIESDEEVEASEFCYNILFKDRKIVLNADGTEAILIVGNQQHGDRIKKVVYEQVLTEYFDGQKLNQHMYDLTKQFDYMHQNNYTLRYSFSSMSIDSKLYQRRIMNTLKKLKLKNFSKLDLNYLKMFDNRIKKEKEKILSEESEITQFICERGIESFLEGGVLNDFAEISGAFDDFERISVVHQTLLRMLEGYNVRLIKKGLEHHHHFLKVIKYFEIYFDSKELMIAKHLCKNALKMPEEGTISFGGRSIEYAVVIKDPVVIRAFEVFYTKLLSGIAESKQTTFNQIKQLIVNKYAHHTNHQIQNILGEIESLELDEESITFSAR